jgi:hypothetical protein
MAEVSAAKKSPFMKDSWISCGKELDAEDPDCTSPRPWGFNGPKWPLFVDKHGSVDVPVPDEVDGDKSTPTLLKQGMVSTVIILSEPTFRLGTVVEPV